ncbi:hypothetical protein HMPREF3291_20500 [Bacillus sp. HMSC76G11]|nr:hypothetical protein HMPREF3291_20500 [Bacillus sp. HMSC76G11]
MNDEIEVKNGKANIPFINISRNMDSAGSLDYMFKTYSGAESNGHHLSSKTTIYAKTSLKRKKQIYFLKIWVKNQDSNLTMIL